MIFQFEVSTNPNGLISIGLLYTEKVSVREESRAIKEHDFHEYGMSFRGTSSVVCTSMSDS